MFKKYFSLIISILCVLSVLLNSQCRRCKDPSNPACDNYDPCYKKLNADFSMKIYVDALGGRYFDVDTVFPTRTVIFEAFDSTDVEYEWKIGDDPEILRTRKTHVMFPFTTQLKVRLVVKHRSHCAAISSDTVTKLLTVIPFSEFDRLHLGYYQGALQSNLEDTFTIQLRRTFTLPVDNVTIIDNLLKGCMPTIDPGAMDRNRAISEINHRQFVVGRNVHFGTTGHANCVIFTGWGTFDKSGKIITFDFKYMDTQTGVIKNESFIGRKK